VVNKINLWFLEIPIDLFGKNNDDFSDFLKGKLENFLVCKLSGFI
jgi:hypothetical protein